MGKLLMIQLEDEERIESLKKKLGSRTKVEVVRAGLRLLEMEAARCDRVNRWKKVASMVSRHSMEVNKEFQKHSRLKRS